MLFFFGMRVAMNAPLFARLVHYLDVDSVSKIIGLLGFQPDLSEDSPHFRRANQRAGTCGLLSRGSNDKGLSTGHQQRNVLVYAS